jgi:hypothetical protein
MDSTTKLLADTIVSTPTRNLQQELIRTLVSHDSTVGVKGEDDFLSEQKLCGEKVDGNKCISLLNECINGTSEQCKNEWSKLNWGAGIDWERMDYGAASNLSKKLGLSNGVESVVSQLTAGVPDKTASDSLKMALQAIQNRISPSPSQNKPISSKSNSNRVKPRTSVVPMDKMNMIGGANKCNYANFVRCINSVKTNILMKGGSEHAIVLRNGLSELQHELEKRHKTIQKDDLVRIKDLIDNLERIENRAQTLGIHMTKLNSALKQDSILIPDDKKEITLKYMEELSEEINKLMSESSSKALNLVQIFEQLDDITRRLQKISS